MPSAPDDIATRSCNCKDDCNSRRCICRRWGGGCKHSCKCQDRYCGNRFDTYLSVCFGHEELNGTPLRATYCFTDYAEKADKIDIRRPYNTNEADATQSNLESLLLADDSFFESSDELRAWRGKLEELAVVPEDRHTHIQWLFRMGLSTKSGNKYFYSFCIKGWAERDTYRHCAACNKCYPIGSSWHCGVCRQCRHDGLDQNCSRCGGRSSAAKLRQEKEYDYAAREFTQKTPFFPESCQPSDPRSESRSLSRLPSAKSALNVAGRVRGAMPALLTTSSLEQHRHANSQGTPQGMDRTASPHGHVIDVGEPLIARHSPTTQWP